jgi:hypothetical protein
MLQVLANRTYGRLFLAQVIALLGTGLDRNRVGIGQRPIRNSFLTDYRERRAGMRTRIASCRHAVR